jgi:hypothetical protein
MHNMRIPGELAGKVDLGGERRGNGSSVPGNEVVARVPVLEERFLPFVEDIFQAFRYQ